MSAASFDAPGTDRDLGSEAYRPEDFPGCESFHLPASEIDHYEGRLEFWDGVTETAWKVCEPTSIQHEQPSRRLVRMAERVASLRGSAIECFGSADLVRRDAAGRKRWLMQADEVLYLHPDRVRLQGPAIDVDADPLPDVVLEVDHTTDVRRRKLGIYKESGFPEIWVLVPWEASVRAPGLAIHVRRGGGYREEPASRAFPGWKAEEIHRALTEAPCRKRRGEPWKGPLWRWGNARARRRSTIRSWLRRAQGCRQGATPGHVAATLRAPWARGIEMSSQILEDWRLLAGLPIRSVDGGGGAVRGRPTSCGGSGSSAVGTPRFRHPPTPKRTACARRCSRSPLRDRRSRARAGSLTRRIRGQRGLHTEIQS